MNISVGKIYLNATGDKVEITSYTREFKPHLNMEVLKFFGTIYRKETGLKRTGAWFENGEGYSQYDADILREWKFSRDTNVNDWKTDLSIAFPKWEIEQNNNVDKMTFRKETNDETNNLEN